MEMIIYSAIAVLISSAIVEAGAGLYASGAFVKLLIKILGAYGIVKLSCYMADYINELDAEDDVSSDEDDEE